MKTARDLPLAADPQPDFRAIFESAPGLLLILTPGLRIVAATNSYLRVTKTVRDKIIGRLLFEVMPDYPHDPDASGPRNLRASLERVLQNKTPDTMPGNSADRNAVDHVERMLALYPNFWQGIGEVFLRHDDLTALTYGDVPRATSNAFSRLLDLAAARDLPVLVHSDIGPAWLEQPAFLAEVEVAIQAHPKTRIIWAHAGISRRIIIPNHTDILHRMLAQYPNLTIDLSWVIFEQEIAPGGTLDRKWASLIEEYPNRFVIGSDTVGFFDQYKPTLQRYYVLLDALKPSTARKVAHDNFLALLPTRRSAVVSR